MAPGGSRTTPIDAMKQASNTKLGGNNHRFHFVHVYLAKSNATRFIVSVSIVISRHVETDSKYNGFKVAWFLFYLPVSSHPMSSRNFKKVGHVVGTLACIGKFDQISASNPFIYLIRRDPHVIV